MPMTVGPEHRVERSVWGWLTKRALESLLMAACEVVRLDEVAEDG